MPKLIDSAPKYRKHKPSGQAVVTIAGKDYYLGPHGSRPSRRLYDRLVGEWMVGGRVDQGVTEARETVRRFARIRTRFDNGCRSHSYKLPIGRHFLPEDVKESRQ